MSPSTDPARRSPLARKFHDADVANDAEISALPTRAVRVDKTKFLSAAHKSAATMVAKRVMDISISAAALAVLGLPLLFVAALVRLTSPGPAIFRQRRTGLNGRTFTIFKFRTMYRELQDVSGVKHTVENDPRVTGLGQILRKYSVDELPQLLNVLWGDMSIVGPRAHPVAMVALGKPYDVLVPEYDLRNVVKPGLTGQAQVRGYRGEVCDEAHARGRIAEDLDYIRNLSIVRDLGIILATIPAVISTRAAK